MKKRSSSCHVLFWDTENRLPNDKSNFVPTFSLYQSNVLYFFFFFGAFGILFWETYMQTSKHGTPFIQWLLDTESGEITKIVTAILVFNLLLWLDFIRDFKENSTKEPLRKIISWKPQYPFIWCYNLCRYKVFGIFPNMCLMSLQQAQKLD